MGKVACEGNAGELEPNDGSARKISMMNAFVGDHPKFKTSRLLRSLQEIERNHDKIFYEDEKIHYFSDKDYNHAYRTEQLAQMGLAAKENPGMPKNDVIGNWVLENANNQNIEWGETHYRQRNVRVKQKTHEPLLA